MKLDLSNTILQTDRMIIRPWKISDLDDFFEYASKKDVAEMAGWIPHRNIKESKEVLEYLISEKDTLALELKENRKVIGSVGIMNPDFELEPSFDFIAGKELGFILSKSYWGNGLMPEALNIIIDHCFEKLEYDYLCMGYFTWNFQSKRISEKLGFINYRIIQYETDLGTEESLQITIRHRNSEKL